MMLLKIHREVKWKYVLVKVEVQRDEKKKRTEGQKDEKKKRLIDIKIDRRLYY